MGNLAETLLGKVAAGKAQGQDLILGSPGEEPQAPSRSKSSGNPSQLLGLEEVHQKQAENGS